MPADGPILLCYDGSDDAAAAIKAAAKLLEGQDAVAVCFWQPFSRQESRFAINLLELVQDPDSVNVREGELAQQIADEGADLANEAGLHAEGHAVEVNLPIDEAIIVHADQIDAPLIVLGSRGRSSVSSILLGDVANDVAQRSSRPVFLTPSPRRANRRRRALTDDNPAG